MTKIRLLLITAILLLILPLHVSGHESGEDIENISLNSEAAILIDANSGEVLYDKYGDQSMYPASITKIVTAIIAIEEGNLDDTVTISENARDVAGTRVYLEPGEKVKMEKLVKGLLINSGNDAGVAIAEHIDGSVEDFSDRMNRFVKEKIGVNNTHFENPHGLYDADHVTTAEDMAKITQYAMKNEEFREIAAIEEMKWDGESWDTTLYNHHQLVRQRDDVTGVKNGFVSQSGFTLVTSASQDHIDLIVVTLKADSADFAYQDTEKLLDYGFENFETYTVEATPDSLHLGNSEYILEEDFVFTAEKGIDWNQDFTEDGKLEIENEQGETIETRELTEVVQASTMEEHHTLDEDTETKTHQISVWGIVLGVLGLLLVLMMVNIIKKHRRRRFFY
ncbi:D-alanyl-D-alanine carboxypeptidase family protein [Piscibacillus halophilus]|uniref:D-alanyl-D-alanine carboxypeptidase/D-alanyl-D-alanine carboxypeptidase (Penicillin-binding protein 5/6) n=1 Tax=Piscibacillus halophilus TaxID=571933 RepID=A0A1H9IM92_9BACI|nr:D-alanyl-D-alanine carboxypeptidase family protein [Piscibacillus halophilus]SEQ75710.1 D-alanyl-D-alanine carboxypeptidase/D-alanyl-D-alanine carboxypeptidase (penicillin-binding protein 5/6) [Piscibacillus halophilus]